MNSFEVLDRRCAPKVEEVFPNTNIPSTVSFARCDVRERMLDGRPFSQQGAARFGLLEFAKVLLAAFVGGDGDGSAFAGGGLRALRTQGTCTAGFWIELDGFAWFELLHLSRRACERLGAQINLEVVLRK